MDSSKPFPTRRRWRLGRRFAILGLIAVAVIVVELATLGLLSLRKVEPVPASVVFSQPEVIQQLQTMVREQPRDPEWPVRLGLAFLEDGHYLSAIEAFNRALELRSPEITPRRGLGVALRGLDRNQEALAQWRRLAELNPELLQPQLEIARELRLLGDTKGAVAHLKRLALDSDGFPQPKDPGGPPAGAESLSAVYAELGEWNRSLALAEKVATAHPERGLARLLAGRARLERREFAEAAAHLAYASRLRPQDSQARWLYAQALLRSDPNGNRDELVAILERLVKDGAASGEANFELARLQERKGKSRLAAEAYIRAEQADYQELIALSRAADNFLRAGMKEDGYYTRGRWHEAMGEPEAAIREYSRLLAMHDCCQSGYLHVARLRLKMKQPKQALSLLQKARKVGSPTPPLLVAFADVYHALDDLDNEKKSWEEYARLDPENADLAYQRLGVARSKAGHLDEADAYFRKCVELQPKADLYRIQVAMYLLQRRNDPVRLKEAIAHLEEAVKINPRYASVFYHLGVSYRYANRNDEAIWALRHAVDLEPGEGKPYTPLGQLLQAAGKTDEAKQVLALAKRYAEFYQAWETLRARTRRNPDDLDARRRLAAFYERTGAVAEAVNEYQTVLRLRPNDPTATQRLIELARRREQTEAGTLVMTGLGE